MATAVIMPKLGNSVESTIIVEWKKHVGDVVAEGDILCDVETDKAVMEVPSTSAGTLLALLADAGDEVPVMAEIAVIGEAGEDVSGWSSAEAHEQLIENGERLSSNEAAAPAEPAPRPSPLAPSGAISPRARHLAEGKGVDVAGVRGTGPEGRIIERDVLAALAAQPKLTPVAKAMVESGDFTAPAQGSGPRGRVTKSDLISATSEAAARPTAAAESAPRPAPLALDEVTVIPVKGVRKVIAQRMLASLQTTAQLTLNASADARAMQALRARFKASDEALGLRSVTLNDLVLLATARALREHPTLNALFEDESIKQYRAVHLGVAVDTPRGLLVPVIRHADTLSLKQLAMEAKRLAVAAQEGKATMDELNGGTFTVTNLGAFGIESFTPVLNPPQVAILGVSNIQLKPVSGADGAVEFLPHIGLSLTINHQVVDGAPAARFLQTLARYLADVDLLLAL
jgi:pyruvate dehydrogenase E2 component (dihydrolipoamide acetyltransferase)